MSDLANPVRRGILAVFLAAAACAAPATPPRDRGDWPIARHDVFLSARQTLPGAMKTAPVVLARYETPKTQAGLTPVDLDNDSRPDIVLAFRAGNLRAFDFQGRQLWQAPASGVTYASLLAAADVDGDGKMELVLQTGNPGSYAPAAVVLDATSGALRSKVAFPAGCFSWTLKVGAFVPGVPGRQLALVNSMQVDPARAKRGGKGLIALWSFEDGADKPRERWCYEAEGFNIEYPAPFFEDLDGDGRPDFFVTSWCYLYLLDPATGRCRQHFGWEPKGANHRHYGWDQLVDMDGDGDLDFVCVAVTKHVDVLLNDKGKFSLAWTVGWPDAVTLSKLDFAHAPWPAVDLDGDGRREVIFSLFNEKDSGRWKLYVVDGVTGAEKAALDDLIPRSVVDLDGDGEMELFASRNRGFNRDAWEGVELLDWRKGELNRRAIEGAGGLVTRAPQIPTATVWISSGNAYMPQEVVSEKLPSGGSRAWLRFGDKTRAVTLGAGGEIVTEEAPPPAAPPPAQPAPDVSKIAPDGGEPPNPVLVADLDGDGINEVLLAGKPAKVLKLRGDRLEVAGELPAECAPVIADLDGDGAAEVVVGERGEDRNLRVTVLDARTRKPRWSRALPETKDSGVIFGIAPLYVSVGRFTGGPHLDVYVFVNKPEYRAMVLRGADGTTVWEKKEPMPIEGQPEGYGPYNGPCAVYDVNGDGADDLLFASPSFMACASGRDASILRTPRLVTNSVGAWAGYSSPVLCPQPQGPPVIQLMNAWATTGAWPLGAGPEWPKPIWATTQEPGEWRSGAEAVFRDARRPGQWCVAWPDHGGHLICREVETGKQRWTYALGGLTPAPVVGDVDGDGRDEIVIAGSDGRVVALRDAGDPSTGSGPGHAEVVWELDLGMPCGPPLLADVNGDGVSELLVAAADGVLYVLGRR